MKCKRCGKLVQEHYQFCGFCGEKIEQATNSKRCNNCEIELPEGTKVCVSCGKSVVD